MFIAARDIDLGAAQSPGDAYAYCKNCHPGEGEPARLRSWALPH
jgi:hypothetical protein